MQMNERRALSSVLLWLSCCCCCTALRATELARTQIFRAAKFCPGHNPPPPAPPHFPGLRLAACNPTDQRQRWDVSPFVPGVSDRQLSPRADHSACVTRGLEGAPLTVQKCRGYAGQLDPLQQWKFTSDGILATGDGKGCADVGTGPTTAGVLYAAFPCKQAPNELFNYSVAAGLLSSGYSRSAPLCVVQDEAMVSLDANNCIPWSIDPQNTEPGWYFDAGMCGMVLTSNDTLISIHEGEKFHHQDDNNRIDIVIRRSFDQGRTWQPWQLVHTGSNATHQVTIGQGTPVLDQHTGRLWLFMTRNNTFLLLTYTDDHGATWAPVRDITAASKPASYGWIAPAFSGTQLASGRLAVCADHIVGQWTAYPITHTISSVITSDDHGASWQWQPAGSPDGAEMNECAIAVLPNNSLVMNARNYIGIDNHTVKRAIMWSHDEGRSWIGPYLDPDLPDPVVQGSMVAGLHTPAALGIGQPLFFTNAHSEWDRANDTLMMSRSGGAGWEPLLQLQHGCSEYTGLVQFRDGRIGAGFDDGGPFPPNYTPGRNICKMMTNNETFVLVGLT